MNFEKPVSLLFSIVVLGAYVMAAAPVVAAERVLAFHGSLVSAGCDARLSGPDPQQLHFQSLKVNRQITLSVDGVGNACGGAAIPLVAGYAEQPVITSGSRTGIVTLSYQ